MAGNTFDVQARFTAKDETAQAFAKLTQSTRSLRAELGKLTADQKVADAQAKLAADRTLKNMQALEKAQGRQLIASHQAKLANLRNLQEQAASVTKLEGQFGRLGNVATGAMSALTTVIQGGVVAALAAATAGAIALGNALSEAGKREIAAVRATTGLMREFGVGRGEATKINKDIIGQVLTKTPAFASNELALNLAAMFGDDIGKAVGKGKVAGTTAQFASKFAALLVGDEGNAGQLTNVLTDILSGGATVGQLKGRDILNSTGLNKVLIPLLQQKGIDNLGDVNVADRLNILMTALNTVATDESLIEQSKTVAGQWSSVQKKIFDPFSGFLGVERDLGNGQTVFESFKRTMNLLFSESGLFAQFGGILGDFDPMQTLNQGLGRLNRFIESITGAIKEGDSAQIGYQVGEFAADLFNNILQASTKVDWTQVAIGVAYGLGSFLQNLDWGSLVSRAGFAPMVISGVVTFGNQIMTRIVNAATSSASTVVSTLINAATQFATAIGNAITNAISGVTSAISNAASSNATSSVIPSLPPVSGLGIAASVVNAIAGKADGQIPPNIMGIIAQEMRSAPGTTPVVANSSELILPPAQIPGFIQAIRSQGSSSINIDLGGMTFGSTNDLDMIMEAINRRLRSELRAKLA